MHACMHARTHMCTPAPAPAPARTRTHTPDKEFFAFAHGVFNEAEDLLRCARNDTCSRVPGKTRGCHRELWRRGGVRAGSESGGCLQIARQSVRGTGCDLGDGAQRSETVSREYRAVSGRARPPSCMFFQCPSGRTL